MNRRPGLIACAVAVVPLLSGCGGKGKPVPGATSREAAQLADAVNRNDAAAIRNWLAKGQSPDIVFFDGTTVLHAAAGMGALESVEALLQGEASVHIRDNTGRTPLHRAAQHRTPRQKEIIQLLLAAGAKSDATDNGGKTPLDYAAADENETVAALLRPSPTN